ncbi:hypothetical protein OG216_34890 [Streptomycetaceae bacterium NBC_01309]
MDPNDALEDLREYARLIAGEVPGAAEEWGDTLAEAFLALDEWLSRGADLPGPWDVYRPNAA